MNEMDPLRTTAEAAKVVNLPESTLRYYRHVGTGPRSAKVGGRRVMYRQSDLENWLDSQFEPQAPTTS